MPRLAAPTLAALALVLAAAPAPAEDDAPRAVLGRVLTTARDSGALERVLGERFFRYDARPPGAAGQDEGEGESEGEADGEGKGKADDEPEFVMILRGRAAEETCTLEAEIVGREVRLRVAYTLGFDGGLRTVAITLAERADQVEGSGEVTDGVLSLELRTPDGARTEEIAWPDDAVPETLAMFFLPSLADQGLPDPFRFRPFSGEDFRLEPGEAVLEGAGEVATDDGPARDLVVRILERRQLARIRVLAADDRPGELREVVIDDRKRITPLAPEDAAAWLDRFGAR